ncbi:DUF1642 domain-containing protein [Enterococcus faecium]|uniref:DUF1642 domain-containing protein n=1 Tax=Enterococcus faecium TaxID=1352 RepID=UPI0018AA79BF|nr:DUF1642 domain-containing protein [Enterococcus faecium]
MNKQELIEILEELKENAKRSIEIDKYEDYWRGKTEAYVNLIGLAKQLDEPQKPVVPKFVADWISFCKNKNKDLNYAMHDNFLRNFLLERFGDNDNRVRWLTDYKNQEIFARAWLEDYEVEKEPLYRVKIGEGYFVEYQGRGALIMPDCNKEIKIFDSKSDAERTAQTIGGTVVEVEG